MKSVIKPFTDTNAVKVVAFALKLEENFTFEALSAVIEKLRCDDFFKKEFNKINDQVEVSLTIGPDGSVQHNQSMNGIVFEKKENEDSQPSWVVSINKDSILVNCFQYTRWKNIFPESESIISKVFKIIGSKNIESITLEYLDEFEILDVSSDWIKSLFKQDSGYLLKNIFECKSFWHINHGYFIDIDGLSESILNNLFINYFADEHDGLKNKVHVRAQHRLGLNEEYDNANIARYFNAIHEHSKSIFENMIHDDILELFDRKG